MLDEIQKDGVRHFRLKIMNRRLRKPNDNPVAEHNSLLGFIPQLQCCRTVPDLPSVRHQQNFDQ